MALPETVVRGQEFGSLRLSCLAAAGHVSTQAALFTSAGAKKPFFRRQEPSHEMRPHRRPACAISLCVSRWPLSKQFILSLLQILKIFSINVTLGANLTGVLDHWTAHLCFAVKIKLQARYPYESSESFLASTFAYLSQDLATALDHHRASSSIQPQFYGTKDHCPAL